MSRKDNWKRFGKNTGNAFKNFGKAVAQTAKIAVGNENNDVEENGQSKLRNAWSKTGKGFGSAGKSLGKAASGTFKNNEEQEEVKQPEKPSEQEVIDVESNVKEEDAK